MLPAGSPTPPGARPPRRGAGSRPAGAPRYSPPPSPPGRRQSPGRETSPGPSRKEMAETRGVWNARCHLCLL